MRALTEMLATDYPGFIDKTATSQYRRFEDSLFVAADKITNLYNCYKILGKLTGFFKDPHLSLNINSTTENKENIREMFSEIPDPPPPHSALTNSASLPIEGFWEVKNQGTDYQVNIRKDGIGNYVGVITNSDGIFWHSGQTKFFITARSKNLYNLIFFLRDHTPVSITAMYDSSGILDLKNYGIWQRPSPVNRTRLDSILTSKRSIYVRSVNATTTYLRIPSFAPSNLSQMEYVENTNKDLLQKQILIIDLRSNGGGSTMISDVILKYIYDKPLVYEGNAFLNSKRNAEDIQLISSRPEYKTVYDDFLKEKLDQIIHSPINTWVAFSPGKTEKMDSVFAFPKQVYILVDKASASATEYFLLEARQSSKVKIVGQTTRGAVDYTDIGLPRILPCPLFYLQTPMIRSDRVNQVRMDNVGIIPDILVPDDEDALSFLLNRLRNE